MGRTDEGAKRPVTRRLRLLVVRHARCGVSSHRYTDPILFSGVFEVEG